MPNVFAAQQSELIALTRACQVAKGKPVNIYTDSCYAFGVAHDFAMLLKQRGSLTSSGQPIKIGKQVVKLLDANLLLSTLAVIKVSDHSEADTADAKGSSS